MIENNFDHDTIEANSILERYHLGTLSVRDEERFEAHLMDCVSCQEELEVQASFLRGIKEVGAQEAARSAVQMGLLAWLLRRRVLGSLAALLVVAAGVLWVNQLLRQNRSLETQIAKLEEAGPAKEQPFIGPLVSPLAGTPVVLLGILRGEDSQPTLVIDPGEPYSLALDAGADPRITSYSVTIRGEGGDILFEGRDLLPNNLEVIQLTFPAGFFPEAQYRLVARGSLSGGETLEVGSYAFRIETNE